MQLSPYFNFFSLNIDTFKKIIIMCNKHIISNYIRFFILATLLAGFSTISEATSLRIQTSLSTQLFDADVKTGPSDSCWASQKLINIKLTLYKLKSNQAPSSLKNLKPFKVITSDSQGIAHTNVPKGFYLIHAERTKSLLHQIEDHTFTITGLTTWRGTPNGRIYYIEGSTRLARLQLY